MTIPSQISIEVSFTVLARTTSTFTNLTQPITCLRTATGAFVVLKMQYVWIPVSGMSSGMEEEIVRGVQIGVEKDAIWTGLVQFPL